MKNFLLFFVCTFFVLSAISQTGAPKLAPYQRYPNLPPIQILLSDSSTLYTKAQIPDNKPVLFMIFSPDCSHCQHETEEMVAHADELKDVQIIMITYEPLYAMRNFITSYGLAKYPNIVVGKDIHYMTIGFFDVRSIPYLAMYNKKGNLIIGMNGPRPITEVIKILNGEK